MKCIWTIVQKETDFSFASLLKKIIISILLTLSQSKMKSLEIIKRKKDSHCPPIRMDTSQRTEKVSVDKEAEKLETCVLLVGI